MSAGYELPEREFIHGYLLIGGEKMSKTRGNVLDPFAVIEPYGVDPLRFYLLREVTFGLDGDHHRWSGFERRYNTELANELGNLVSRTVSMVGKYRGGRVPATAGPPALAREAEAAVAEYGRRMDEIEVTAALEALWELVRRLNRYVEEEAPWKLAKDEAQAPRLDEVLYGLVAGLRLVALCLHPFMPSTAVEIMRRIGQPRGEDDLRLDLAVWDLAVAGSSSRRRRCSRASRSSSLPGVAMSAPAAAGLVDSHCHLDLLSVGADEALAGAREAGVDTVVAVGIDVASSSRAVDLARRHDGVYATVGLHPHDASTFDDRVLDELEAPGVVAQGSSRSARPGSTSTATARRATRSGVPSSGRWSWRARPARRSSCTCARRPPTPSRCSPSTPRGCASSCTASRRPTTSGSATRAATTSRSPAT